MSCDKTRELKDSSANSWLTRCPDFAETGKAPIEQNAQCGNFLIRENPDDNNSAMININVLRLPAINPVPEKDPLFIIAGGPGQSAVAVAESIHASFNEVRKNRDIIFVDQRGTGKSNPLNCDLEDDTNKQLSQEQQKQLQQKILQQCLERYAGHLPYYTTPFAVNDLDIIRNALGYEKINLWGGSYGTRVALEYMRRYPAHLRTSVLDGVAPVAIALPWNAEADSLAALEKLNAQCAQSLECITRYGNIVEKAQHVADQLLQKDVVITIPHPRTQLDYTLHLNHTDFAAVVRLALYSRDLSTLLPQAISDADSGNFKLIASFMFLAKSKNEMADLSYGMHYTVACNEDYPQYKEKNAAESQHFLHLDAVTAFSEICSQWPRSSLPADYWNPVTSSAPVLLLSGEDDPVTPPRWAELVKQTLDNAVHIVAPGGHHLITQEGCTSQLIASFIAAGDAKKLDTHCINNILPLAIHLTINENNAQKTDKNEH